MNRVIERLLETKTPVVVSVSGKDSVGMWLSLLEHGVQVVGAFTLYLVPGLEFQERHLRRLEAHFKTRIERWPHPQLNRMLRNGVWQPPERAKTYERLAVWSYNHLDRKVRRTWRGAWQAIGNRVNDNFNRRVASKLHHAEWNIRRRVCWPVFDMSTEDILRHIERARLTLPLDYRMFGRSFDGLVHQYLEPIRQQCPADYARILEWFPLIGCERVRRRLT